MVYEPALSQPPGNYLPTAQVSSLAIDTELSTATHLADQDIEIIVQWTNILFSSKQIIKAKEDYYWKSGKVFPHEEWFHQRMSYFIDQYVFSRILEITDDRFQGKTPFEAYQSDPHLPALSLTSFRHSLFKVTKISSNSMQIKDLIEKKKHVISSRPHEIFHGIEKNFLFQGFFYVLDDAKFLSRGLIFHPDNCHGLIAKCVKKLLKSDQRDEAKFLSFAAKTQLRNLRHPHVNNLIIYKELPANSF